VLVMMDECVGHMTEKVVIPKAEEIDIYPRRRTKASPADFKPYAPGPDMVPEMAHAGEGYRFHVTGLTHDERGYPSMTPTTQDRLVRRIKHKFDGLQLFEEEGTEGADVIVISYGITSRVAQRAIDMAREQGMKVGKFRLISAWPFPEKRLRELAAGTKAFVVPELNLGQMVLEVERCAGGQAKTISVTHAGGGVHRPEDILNAIREAV
jgi:2-oxoglutarate ferredoxin oxidoreductase subunit alpha